MVFSNRIASWINMPVDSWGWYPTLRKKFWFNVRKSSKPIQQSHFLYTCALVIHSCQEICPRRWCGRATLPVMNCNWILQYYFVLMAFHRYWHRQYPIINLQPWNHCSMGPLMEEIICISERVNKNRLPVPVFVWRVSLYVGYSFFLFRHGILRGGRPPCDLFLQCRQSVCTSFCRHKNTFQTYWYQFP